MLKTSEIMRRAKAASREMVYSEEKTNNALLAMADALLEHKENILLANQRDMEESRGKISEVMLDRLYLDNKRLWALSEGIRSIASLPSPLKCEEAFRRPNGLLIRKNRVPLGVIAIIYESRPGVTADAAALAIKSGNAVILRGGKEAYRTSSAIVSVLAAAVEKSGLPKNCIQQVEDTSRGSAEELMKGRGYIDLLIPRGGAGLIRTCVENATVPCIETGTGICHIYIDKSADIEKAVKILDNAKTSRPSVCNAAEVCLVHRDIVARVLPEIKKALVERRVEEGLVPVELRLDEECLQIIDGVAQSDTDYDTEFLDYRLAIGVVGSVEEAIKHINLHSTGHSETIISEDEAAQKLFTTLVDSACVYVNASTRFTDGGEFGFGCEMGIATGKLHARGPMGLYELTTYKYVIEGDGQIR